MITSCCQNTVVSNTLEVVTSQEEKVKVAIENKEGSGPLGPNPAYSAKPSSFTATPEVLSLLASHPVQRRTSLIQRDTPPPTPSYPTPASTSKHLVPTRSESILLSPLVLHSVAKPEKHADLVAFLSTLSASHLAPALYDVFVDLGFTTNVHLDALSKSLQGSTSSRSWVRVQERVEQATTFADWMLVEEGLVARAERLTAAFEKPALSV